MVTRLNQTDFVKTALRLPPDLHAKLHEGAEASGRSYNAEIVQRLESTFTPITGVMAAREGESQDARDEVIGALRQTAKSQRVAILMLQTYLVDVINQLPKSLRNNEHVRLAAKFAMEVGDDEPEIASLTGQMSLLGHVGQHDAVVPVKARKKAKIVVVGELCDGDIQPGSVESVDADSDSMGHQVSDPAAGSGSYLEAAHKVLTKRGLAGVAMTVKPAGSKAKSK